MSQKDEVERIVSMKFDNGQFEKGVSTSLKTIDQLKKSLDFSDTEKKLEEFQNSGKNFDVSGIIAGIENIESHFSLLGQAVMRIKNGIISEVADIGRSVKGIMGTGWGKYEQETAAVQTMMGNMTEADLEMYMLAQGKIEELGKNQLDRFTNEEIEQDKIDYIEENLERITWFADETSYSYDDMTSSLAKFLASGGKIEESTSAVIGLAVAAADAGVSTTNASRAYYNFAQAISAGRMRLQDWNSIVQLNMNTPKFMQNLIDTAVEVGTLAETTDGLYTVLTKSEKAVDDFTATMGFGESLAGNWMTSEVMFKAFEMYGSYADMLYEVQKEMDLGTVAEAADYLEELGISYAEVAKVGFDAAQNTKTFTEAVDFLKDALSTQFKGVYKTVFGGFIEARDLWSELSEIFYNNLVAPMEGFNDLLSEWAGREEGGRDSLINAFGNGVEAIIRLLDLFKESISEAFPPLTADKLSELTLRFEEWTETLIMSDETFNNLKSVLVGIFKAINAILQIIRDVVGFAKPGLKKAAKLIVNISGKLGNLLGKVSDGYEEIGGLSGIIEICTDKLEQWRQKIKDATGIDLHIPKWEEITDVISRFTAKVNDLTGLNLHIPSWEEIVDALTRFKDKIVEITGIDFHLPTWEEFKNTVLDVVHYLERFLGIDIKMPTLDSLAESVANAINSLREFKDTLFSTEEDTEKLNISDRILNGWGQLGKIIDTVKNKISSLFSKDTKDDAQDTLDVLASSKAGTGWANFKDRLTQIIELIKGPISKVTAGDVFSFAFIGSVIRLIWNMSSMAKGAGTVAKGVASMLESIGKGVKSFLKTIGGGWSEAGKGVKNFFDNLGTLSTTRTWKMRAAAIKDIATAVLMICGSLFLITKVAEPKDILAAGAIIGALILFIGLVGLLLQAMDKSASTGFTLYKSGNKGFLGIGLGIAAILLSLKFLDDYTPRQVLGYLGVIAAIGLILAEMMKMTSRWSGGGFKSSTGGFGAGAGFLLAALALQKMVKVIGSLNELEISNKKKLIEVLIVIVGSLALLMKGVNGIKFGSGLGVVAAVAAVGYLVKIISKLSDMDMSKLKENKGILWTVLGILAILDIVNAIANSSIAKKFKGSSSKITKIGNNMLGVGMSFLLIALSLKLISNIKFDNYQESIGALAMIFFGIGILIVASIAAGEHAKKAGRMILTISVAMMLMVGVLALVSMFKMEQIEKGIVFIGGLMAFFAILIVASALLEKGTKSIVLLTGAIFALTLLGYAMAKFAPDSFIPTILGMGGLMVAFGSMVALVGKMKVKNFWKTVGIVAIMAALVTGMTYLMSQCTKLLAYNWQRILAYFGGISLVIIALGAAGALFNKGWKNVKGALPSMIPFLGLAIAAGILIFTLNQWSSKADPENAVALTIAAGVLILEIAGLSKLIVWAATPVKNAWGTMGIILSLTLLTGGLMWAMTQLSQKVDPDGCKALAESAGDLLVKIAAVAALGIVVGLLAEPAAIGMVLITAFLVLLAGVIDLMGVILDAEDMTKGVEVITKIGEALGGFIGGLVGGFVAGKEQAAYDILPDVADKLSGFAEKIEGFYDVAGAPENLLDRMKDVYDAAEKAKDLGKIKFKDETTTFTKLDEYTTKISEFANLLTAIPDGGFDRMDKLAGIMDSIRAAASGAGFDSDIEAFGHRLVSFGISLVTFGSHMTILPSDLEYNATRAANVIKTIAEASYSIEPSGYGNFTSWFVGADDLETFGKRLAAFGASLGEFSRSMADISENEVDKQADTAAAVLSAFTAEAANIPTTGLFGEAGNLETFGKRIAGFAEHLSSFSNTMDGVPADVKEKAEIAANVLSQFSSDDYKVPRQGFANLWSLIVGSNDIGTFGRRIAQFGGSLNSFSTSTTNVTSDVETKAGYATAVLEMFCDSSKSLSNSGGVWGFLAGESNIAVMGRRIQVFGAAIANFSTSMESMTDYTDLPNKAEVAAAVITAMAGATMDVDEVTKGNVFSWIKDAMKTSDFSGRMKTFAEGVADFYEEIKDVPQDAAVKASTAASVITSMSNASASIDTSKNNLLSFIIGNNDLTNFGKNLSKFAESVGDFVDAMIDIDSDEIEYAVTWAKNILSMLSGMTFDDSEKVYAFGGALANLARTGVMDFVDTFVDAKEDAQKAYTTFIGYFLDGVEDPNTRQEFRLAFEGHLTAMIQRISERYIDFYNSGVNTVQGVLQGMKDEIDKIPEKSDENPGVKLAKIVKGGYDWKMAIKSPSRVMMQSGRFTVMGLNEGIEDEIPEVEETATALGEAVQNGLEKVYPKLENAAAYVDSIFGTNLTEKVENLKATVSGYVGTASGLGEKAKEGISGIVEEAMSYINGENGGLIDNTISNMMTEIQNEIGAGFTTELDITPVLDMDELKNSLGVDLGDISGLFDLSGTTSIAEDAIASGLGTNDLLADELSGLRGDVQGFYQAYMDDDGIDTDEIARATEAGVASGLSKANISIDGTTAGKVITNKQNTYERANGGSKVVATWYR